MCATAATPDAALGVPATGLTAESRRILLVGTARSGTSWLGYAMARAPGTRFYYEPDNVDADPTGPVATVGRRGFGPYPMIAEGADDPSFRALWDLVFSGRFPFTSGHGQRFRPAARVALRLPRPLRDPMVRGAAAVSSRLPSRDGWTVVKTIYATLSLDWLVARYQPHVVAIQRNPLNVVSSWRQLRIPLFDVDARPLVAERHLEPLGLRPPRQDASELARISWLVGLLTQVLGDAADAHPEWLVATHEDLCVDPATRIRAVFDAVGLPWSPAVERFLVDSNKPGEGLAPVRVTAEQPDRWRSRLTAAEVSEIEEALTPFPRRGWVRPPAA